MHSPSDDLSNRDKHHIRKNTKMRCNGCENSKQCGPSPVDTRDCLSTVFQADAVDYRSPPCRDR